MSSNSSSRIALADRWLWIMDVIFGGVAAYGFEALGSSLSDALPISTSESILQIFVAICLYVFFLYDVGIYHLLVNRSPFQLTLFSAARFFLDVLMAFLLLMLLLPGLRPNPETRTLQILVTLCLWHVAAAGWHVLASLEYQKRLPPLKAFLPHFYFPIFYWVMMAVVTIGLFGTMTPIWQTINTAPYLITLSSCILLVAVLRTIQVINLHQSQATKSDNNQPLTKSYSEPTHETPPSI